MPKASTSPSIPATDDAPESTETAPVEKPLTPAEIAAPKPPGEVPKNIPTIELPKAETVRYLGQPPSLDKYSGTYIQASTGHKFALAVLPETEVENGKTHFLRNNVYSWNGTKAEFRAQFEKV